MGQLDRRIAELAPGEEPAFHVVEKLQVGDRLLQTWQEAVQRSLVLEGLDLESLAREPRQMDFAFPTCRRIEPVRGRGGEIEAVLVREQHLVAGRVEVSALEVGDGLFKLVARIENDTPFDQSGQSGREQAVLHALASTHTILGVQNGEFLSLIDPPGGCRSLAASCHNRGTWPVLVGREGETDAMLSSPITLYDYPRIAAESPGDFFDGTEIDEMLVLRVQTLTDEEKEAAAAVDERVRALLSRTSSLSDEQMMGLHGVVHGTCDPCPRRFAMGDLNPFLERPRCRSFALTGSTSSKATGCAPLHPVGRADIMDIALDGKIASIEAIEQDFEGRVYLGVVLDDDPGRDLGQLRQPGHCFYFGVEEIEPIPAAAVRAKRHVTPRSAV